MATKKTPYSFLTEERVDGLRKRGWSDEKIKNFAFMVQSEGGPRSEDTYYTTAERMYLVFQNNKFFKGLDEKQGIEKINKHGLLRNSELAAKTLYGDRMGNKGGDDGWLFRGRGYIQLTGRNNYEAVGKRLNVDLLTDPTILERDDDLSWRASVEYIDMNDRNGLGNTAEGMHKIVRPATSLAESMKRVTMLSTKELGEVAKRNSQALAVQKFDAQSAPTPKPVQKVKESVPVQEMPDPNRDAMNKGMMSIQTYMEKKMQEEGLK